MLRKSITIAALFACVAASLLVAQTAPQQPDQAVYTYVAEWALPRAAWADFASNFDKNTRPVLERHAGQGTVVSWGSFATYVHQVDGMTHGVWWSSKTMAGIEQVRSELIRAPRPDSLQQAKHEDFLLRSVLHNGKSGGGTNGFLRVVAVDVQPGKGADFRRAWENNFKATYDELVANGTVLFYQLDEQYVNTENPGRRYFASVLPNAEALDKVRAAFDAAAGRKSELERAALGDALAATTVPGSRRDYLATVSAFANK